MNSCPVTTAVLRWYCPQNIFVSMPSQNSRVTRIPEKINFRWDIDFLKILVTLLHAMSKNIFQQNFSLEKIAWTQYKSIVWPARDIEIPAISTTQCLLTWSSTRRERGHTSTIVDIWHGLPFTICCYIFGQRRDETKRNYNWIISIVT